MERRWRARSASEIVKDIASFIEATDVIYHFGLNDVIEPFCECNAKDVPITWAGMSGRTFLRSRCNGFVSKRCVAMATGRPDGPKRRWRSCTARRIASAQGVEQSVLRTHLPIAQMPGSRIRGRL